MDESHFRDLVDRQQTALAELDALLVSKETSFAVLANWLHDAGPRLRREILQRDRQVQTRLDDTCRLLADAYVACNDAQRGVLRKLVQSFRGVTSCMGLPNDEIRTRIDGARFRLALLYESIKDLHPNAADAVAQLDSLCQAANSAGFDPNPYLREVGEVSSDFAHSGKDSMRKLLLARLVNSDKARCPRCNGYYSAALPACPFCGVNASWLEVKSPPHSESIGEPGPDRLGAEIEVQLPTLRLVGYFLLLVTPVILLILVVCQVAWTFQVEDYHRTRGAWSHKAVILILAAVVLASRPAYARMLRGYRAGYSLWMGCGQLLILLAVVIGLLAALITFLANFAKMLGW